MAIEIIRRKDALAQGLTRYFTGKPCKNHHIAERNACNGRCIKCGDGATRKWRAENTEKVRDTKKKWDIENLEHRRRYCDENRDRLKVWVKTWRLKNPEKQKAMYQRWCAKNPEKLRSYNSLRRSRKLNAGGSYTDKQILDLFKKQKGRCAACFCSIKHGWHNDHIVALTKGGSNYISNIQLLCRPCNQKKSNKDPIVWAQQNGRLL